MVSDLSQKVFCLLDFTLYGCEFVGMPSIFDYIFDDIENDYLKNHSDDEKMNN